MQHKGLLRIALLALTVVLAQGTWALASNTGGIEGKVTDQNGNAVAGARVTAASPSQSASVTTAPNGFYAVLNLSPDTYSVTASKDGYDTTTTYGITVQADQNGLADLRLRSTVRTIGHVTTTATASVVSKSVTGDLYAVNAQAIDKYQGSAGGSETLYSQNSVVGSLPGVVRAAVGSGGGYGAQGQLSVRGGSFDQVGYEVEGVPLNRGFDFYNGTAFVTNGLSSLEVYTGGAPADAGRAMSGYINEQINRGKYPGGADFTAVVGSPVFNHTVQADVYGGTPDNRFTYYVSTLALNSDYNFGNRSNLAGTSLVVPANDPGCNAFNSTQLFGLGSVPHLTGEYLNCGVTNVLQQPQSLSSYSSIPFASERDTVTNLHYSIAHSGLNDDVQALYMVGATLSNPFGQYGTYNSDPTVSNFTSGTGFANGSLTWPTAPFYNGVVGQPYNPALLTNLTWPTSQGSVAGPIPSTYNDSQSTQYSIAKLAYTRSLSQDSFLRVFGYSMYSSWDLDQAINGITGGTFYQLHDNLTGATLNYQNQINQQNLLNFGADFSRDITLRYNYANYLALYTTGANPLLISGNAPPTCVTNPCTPGDIVTQVQAPFSYWSTTVPLDWDGVLSDKWKPSDRLLFDLGLRYDILGFQLMPGMQVTGTNGLAYQAEEQQGQCLLGYAYSPSDPKVGGQNCNSILTSTYGGSAATNPNFNASYLPGAGAWTDPGSYLGFQYWSPRFGTTWTLDPKDVVRFSVGRYVQPPNSAFEQYRQAPYWGPGATVNLLNHFYAGLGFYSTHDVKPEDSTNYDLSFEHEFNGGLSAKLTPYYRDTRNQVLNLAVNPAQPSFVTGYNFGSARISGAEFLITQNVRGENGIGGTLATTYTNSNIRFNAGPGGQSFINVIDNQIARYNADYHTNYAMLDPNGYYPPSFVQTPPATPSYDVSWVINLTVDARYNGFDILPTFNYQSGNPYGDPLMWSDTHCNPTNVEPGCTPLPAGSHYLGGIGPDPYTNQFDSIGSLKGPSWWALNLALSHDVGHNLKASILGTNLLTGIHNQGYPWEQAASNNIISYSDNIFYNIAPLGILTHPANPANAYYGMDYYGYAASSALPTRVYVFSLSAKL